MVRPLKYIASVYQGALIDAQDGGETIAYPAWPNDPFKVALDGEIGEIITERLLGYFNNEMSTYADQQQGIGIEDNGYYYYLLVR